VPRCNTFLGIYEGDSDLVDMAAEYVASNPEERVMAGMATGKCGTCKECGGSWCTSGNTSALTSAIHGSTGPRV